MELPLQQCKKSKVVKSKETKKWVTTLLDEDILRIVEGLKVST